jgi:hypothetical protein
LYPSLAVYDLSRVLIPILRGSQGRYHLVSAWSWRQQQMRGWAFSRAWRWPFDLGVATPKKETRW